MHMLHYFTQCVTKLFKNYIYYRNVYFHDQNFSYTIFFWWKCKYQGLHVRTKLQHKYKQNSGYIPVFLCLLAYGVDVHMSLLIST